MTTDQDQAARSGTRAASGDGAHLRELHDKLDALTKKVEALQGKRWIAVVQALLVAATVPVTAGVFSTCADKRERELKIYDQNLELVDRAVDFDKDVRYRQAILSYMQELDAQRPDGYHIGGWLAANAKLLTEEERQGREHKQQLSAAVQEVEERSRELDQTIEATATKQQLTDADVVAVASKVEALEDKLPEAVEAQQMLQQVTRNLGEPELPKPALETLLVPRTKGVPGGSWVVTISTHAKVSAAEERARALLELGLGVQIYFVNEQYLTAVGPFADGELARQALASIPKRPERNPVVRSLESLCPRATALPRPEGIPVLVCSTRLAPAVLAERLPLRER
ncbi:MAG: hypothetical protein H6712_27445 [Myxococcales bacterium]|nr:hypothetical protein [Myxococcales bacterium]MCB9717613.1 hypothetical protein [Myxococcales bacterium]